MQLQGALDNEVRIIVERFVNLNGLPLDVAVLSSALQRSNSALKRRPRRTLEASLERVIDFLRRQNPQEDGDDDFDREPTPQPDHTADAMNRSLRANLAGPPRESRAETEEPRRAENGESLPKRVKRSGEKKINSDTPSNVSIRDIGGMGSVVRELTKLVLRPLQIPEAYHELQIPPPKGVLLHGPPGCGKTMISRAIAALAGKPFIEILGPSVVSSMSGDSEKALREIFEEAKKQAPCIVFIDEIDAIAPKRDSSQSQMEKRIVAQLLVSMDELHKDPSKPVVVIAATNRPDSIDPALRRGGRFGSEINIGVPNEDVRRQILQVQTRNTPLSADVDFAELAKLTAGFVGSDLHDLVSKAGAHFMDKFCENLAQEATDMHLDVGDTQGLDEDTIAALRFVARTSVQASGRSSNIPGGGFSMDDFLSVLPTITPSSKREGFATIPTISWEDIGALQHAREALRQSIVYPMTMRERYASMGVVSPSGVLLWGPPGCGKTLLAQAAAAESKANFIAVSGPELLNKFVGESEAAVRKVFARARSSVPCVIFFDELDALVPTRDSGANSGASARVVNTLLTELDGINNRKGIFVVAATNRPDVIDEAMLRPGRIGTKVYVDLPGPDERVAIFKTLVRNKPCEVTAELEAFLRHPACEGYSGADLSALLEKASISAILENRTSIDVHGLERAAASVQPSVRDAAHYRAMRAEFGG